LFSVIVPLLLSFNRYLSFTLNLHGGLGQQVAITAGLIGQDGGQVEVMEDITIEDVVVMVEVVVEVVVVEVAVVVEVVEVVVVVEVVAVVVEVVVEVAVVNNYPYE
jgi:hypothetical protein